MQGEEDQYFYLEPLVFGVGLTGLVEVRLSWITEEAGGQKWG